MKKIHYIILIVFILFLFYRYYFRRIRVINHDKETFNDKLQMLDFTYKLQNWYPLNNDFFTIEFGDDYFDFFKQIGTQGFHVVYENDKDIVGSLCARFVRNSWYLCDLKILPEFRGQNLTYKLLLKKFIPSYLKSNRGFAISMYPNETVSKLNNNFKLMNFDNLGFIHIYLVDYETIKKIYSLLTNHFNHKFNGFIDLNQSKKLVLKSGNTLKTLHFYHSDNPKDLISIDDINDDYKFFFCLLEKDNHIIQLKEFGKAILYSYNMTINEFNDLSTADI